MKDLRHPAKSLYQNELNLEDEIIASEEDYHMVTGANRQFRRQIFAKCSIFIRHDRIPRKPRHINFNENTV